MIPMVGAALMAAAPPMPLRKAPPPLPRHQVDSDIDVSLDEPPTEMVDIAPGIEDELVSVCAREIELENARAAPDATRLARLHYEMARALRDDDAALEHYQQALARVPDHLPSIRGARTILLSKRRHEEAVTLFDAEVRLFEDPRDKARLFFAKGRALEDIAGDRNGARECYRRAAELDATSPAYVAALGQVHEQDRAWPALAEDQERAANAVQNDERHRAAIIVERARLYDARLGQNARATELYEQALALDENVAGARGALERLLHDQARWRELMMVLER
ncbi:MAG TPA: hypothetical protein VFB62_23205, partial [Polyangiaceae bacterium]|nr:hypothetical protein [Polyangiaceae bacterium]